ncbi:hypothetical protein B484DRAFT_459456 [Ochromonadaceae sp. CCMP2298]|nr:hypothetical protein B484DRAFT_459456 [Ochromonadaceae sp. CCMP2298]
MRSPTWVLVSARVAHLLFYLVLVGICRMSPTLTPNPYNCRYTPLKRIENMPGSLSYDPIRCNGCSAVLNPFA